MEILQIQGDSHLKKQFLEGGQVAVAGRQGLTASPWVLPDWPEPTTITLLTPVMLTKKEKKKPLIPVMLKHSVGMRGLVHDLHALLCHKRQPCHCHAIDNVATGCHSGRKKAKSPVRLPLHAMYMYDNNQCLHGVWQWPE